MSKHTPEPWKFWGDKEAIVMDKPLHSKHGFIAVMACNEDVSARTSSANARRIVTCVNACAGMADPAAEIAELKRQRDELLGLVKAVSYHSIPVTVDGIKCAAFPWSEYESMVIKAKGSTS